MTDHHHPSIRVPDAHSILYTVGDYVVGGIKRELLLVDIPELDLTLVDRRADSGDDLHIVADGLENCAEAGELADAHVAASIAAGRPAVPTAEPPTPEQLRLLRADSELLGETFQPPKTRAEAARWIRRSHPALCDGWDPRRVARELWEAAHAGRPTDDVAAT